MKRKELRALARKIAKAEQKLSKANDSKEIKQIQQEIMSLSAQVDSLDDIIRLDEFIQDILS